VRPGIERGTQVSGERTLFGDLPCKVPEGVGFDPDRHWWEFYIKPSIRGACFPSPARVAVFTLEGAPP